MKNLENVKALNDMEMAKVAGGMIWPGIPHRRGNKAPVEAPHNSRIFV